MCDEHHVFFIYIGRVHFLPFWDETDCSISAPNIATEKDMTAAPRLPGIIFGDGRCREARAKVTWAGSDDAGRLRRGSHLHTLLLCHAEWEVSLGRLAGAYRSYHCRIPVQSSAVGPELQGNHLFFPQALVHSNPARSWRNEKINGRIHRTTSYHKLEQRWIKWKTGVKMEAVILATLVINTKWKNSL